MRVSALLLLAVAGLAACGSGDGPTAPQTAGGGQRRTIDDWGRYGTEGFYFLPGTPPPGRVDKTFDATLSPTVTVCRVTGGACGSTLATFTKTSGSYSRLVTVNTSGRSYNVSWPVTTGNGYAAGRTYRVEVAAAGRSLGTMDVQVVSNTSQLNAVDTSDYRGVVIGNNFAISFRINQQIPADIDLSASSLTVSVGDGKPITATVPDLHGNALTVDLGWQIVDNGVGSGPVAVLDSGLVVGGRIGTATLYAFYDNLMVSIPVTVNDTRKKWTPYANMPDTEQNRALWGTSATSIYAANATGVLRYNGTSWTHEAAVRWRGMRDVTGTSASDVWAVGDNGFILRYNGTAWSAQRYNGTSVSPYNLSTWDLPGQKVTLRTVFNVPGTPIVGIGGDNGTVLTYDGASWTVYSLGDAAAVTSLWGTAYTNIYVTRSDGRLQYFDGANYSTVPGVTAPGSMNAVWGSSASNVYAVGAAGTVYRYNGTSWSRVRLPTRADLYAVWGSSASNVYVAGANGALYRFDGTTWTPEKAHTQDPQNFGLWIAPGGETYMAGAGGLVAKR